MLHTLLSPRDLSRIRFSLTRADGTRIDRQFFNDGDGHLVEQSAILAPTEPNGDDSHPSEPTTLPSAITAEAHS